MFSPSPRATERARALAARLGCDVGDFTEPYGDPRPALLGSLSAFAVTLKEFGGRWDRTDRVYFFASWPMLEAALQHVLEQRDRLRAG